MTPFSQLSTPDLQLELFAANDVLLRFMKNPRQDQDAFRIEARLHLAEVVAEMRRRVETRHTS